MYTVHALDMVQVASASSISVALR